MATRVEIESLKKQWRHDPIWDIYDTEGFEDHRDELKQYQDEIEAEWKVQREKETADLAIELGCSPQLARYIMNLEYSLEKMQGMIDKVYYAD